MAKKFLTPIDLNGNELQNAVIQALGTPPATSLGRIYLNTAGAANALTYYDTTLAAWRTLATRDTNTYTGKQTFAAASASVSGSLNIPAGSGNTPVSGDLYNVAGALTFHNGAAKTIAYTDSNITGTASKATNLVGGNNTTLLGSMPYQSNTDVTTLLSPNVSATKMFLNQTGTGTNGAAPVWSALVNGDIPTALTGKTYNALTLTALATGFSVAGGTTSKTLTVSNTMTLQATDGSTLNIGTGGTLGTAAFTASSAYATTATRLDQFAAPTASVSMNSQKITNLATPTLDADAATKLYVDNAVAGLSWKDEVRVASTANLVVASGVVNGATVDGVVLATGDRILLKDQTTPAENGIYIVAVSGAASRSTDADSEADITGMAVTVKAGTTNAGNRYVLTTSGTITLGSTALTYSLFSSGTAYTAGNGLTLSTNTFNVGAGTGITVNADDVAIDTAVVVRKYSTGTHASATSIVITHNLNTKDITTAVRQIADDVHVECDVTSTSVNTATFAFATAPGANSLQFTIHG